MKALKVCLAIILIIGILGSLLAISGSAQAFVDKILVGSTLPDETIESDVTTSSFKLVWDEDFENVVLYSTVDATTGETIYFTDNYSSFFTASTLSFPMATLESSENDDSLMLHLQKSGLILGSDPHLNVAFDFSEIFNREDLDFENNRFIVLDFEFTDEMSSSSSLECGEVYFRFRISRDDGSDASVLTNSISYVDNKLAGYSTELNKSNRIIALIKVDETVANSDLYFFINEIGQYAYFEDFLKSDSRFVESFEMLFKNSDGTFSVDDFKLYTFGSGYKGTINDVLQCIGFKEE